MHNYIIPYDDVACCEITSRINKKAQRILYECIRNNIQGSFVLYYYISPY